jgi:hypothetical protein
MELFRIRCVTCGARLSVRNEAVVGQILSCPRCQSMVHVVAPQASGTSGTSGAPPAEPAEPPVEPAADRSATTASEALATSQPAAAEFAQEELSEERAASESRVPSGTGDELPVEEVFEPDYRLWAWGVTGAIIGSTVVSAVLLMRGGVAPVAATDPTASASQSVAAATVSPPSSPLPEPDPVPTADPPEASPTGPFNSDVPEPTSTSPELPPLPEEFDSSSQSQAFVSSAPPAELAPPPLPPAETIGSAPSVLPESAQSLPPEPDEPAPATLRIDPLDVDPEGMALGDLFRPRDALPSWEQVEAESDPQEAAQSEADDEGATSDEDLISTPLANATVRQDPSGTPPDVPPDVAAQLERELAGLQAHELPLNRFLELATSLSGIPVSVDPWELRLAAVAPARAISVDLERSTVESILQQTLRPLRLEAKVEGPQVVVRRPGLEGVREIAYPVADLISEDFPAEAVADWIRELIAPDTWSAVTGGKIQVDGNRLRISQQQRIQYEILFFLERLRVARGLPPKSRYPVERLPLEAPDIELMDLLASRTTFTFSEYTPLSEVVRFWEDQSGLAILVDWPSLQSVGLWPQSQIACRALDKPWSEALDEILAPLDLSWRVVDSHTLQIASSTRHLATTTIAWYHLPEPPTDPVAGWRARIEQLVAATPGAPEKWSVVWDAPSERLIVRQCPAVQRRIARMLRDEAK